METVIAHILYDPDCECELKPINNFYRRKTVEKHLKKYCYYCNDCEFCNAYLVRRAEMKRMGFWTHNKDAKFWDVYDPLWHKDNV